MFDRERQEELLRKIATSPYFMAGVIAVSLFVAADRRALLAIGPSVADGRITSVEERRGSEGKAYYHAKYVFSVKGTEYSGAANIGYSKPDIGAALKVNYLDGHPEVNSSGYVWLHLAISIFCVALASAYAYGLAGLYIQ